MKWTPEKIAELRELAPTGVGSRVIAARMGTTPKSISNYASEHHISLRGASVEGAPSLRARWATLIGPMREQLRSEIAATAEDVPAAAAHG